VSGCECGLTPNAAIVRSRSRSRSMKSWVGASCPRARRPCSSSRTSTGAHSAARTSSTITETRPYSSGQKNTHANTVARTGSPAGRTLHWSRRRPRGASPSRDCLRLAFMASCGGNSGRWFPHALPGDRPANPVAGSLDGRRWAALQQFLSLPDSAPKAPAPAPGS